MKSTLLFRYVSLSVALLLTQFARAQWSVLEGDPRPGNYSGEQYLYQVFTQKEWNASNFATPAQMKWHTDARYGMFIHFGLSAYVDKDISWPIVYNRKAPDQGHGAYPDSAWQKTWPSQFRLEKFNADEWIKIARDAGMKYVVVIAKHHDGFHLWDTKFSDFKITNTPFKRDYLKEVADACHKANMPFGIYYSQRDWYHPDYAPIDTTTVRRISNPPYYEALPGKTVAAGPTHKKYIDYQFNVVKELCTRYGKIDIFWFDAVYWGGMFTADMWDSERLTRMIRQLQPGIIMNNRTSLPGDFDTPEQRIGMYQKRPWESAMTLNNSWAYSPEPVKPVKILIREMLSAAAGNGNVLLSWGAHWNGEFDAAQQDTLRRIGRWLKQNEKAYYGTRGGPWMPSKNGGSVFRGNTVYLYVYDWQRESVALPTLPDNAIVKATLLNSRENVTWAIDGHTIRFARPASPDPVVSIVELTMEKPIRDVVAATQRSLFDDPAYGAKLLTRQLKTTDWKNSQYVIDLGDTRQVTGIGLPNSTGSLQISVSTNGKDWQALSIPTGATRELSITTFQTGVEVPGRSVRYVRLQTDKVPATLQIDVFAK